MYPIKQRLLLHTRKCLSDGGEGNRKSEEGRKRKKDINRREGVGRKRLGRRRRGRKKEKDRTRRKKKRVERRR